MYNTDEKTVHYFAGTESHNTLMLGDYDQMQKGVRFVWFYPPVLVNAKLEDSYFDFRFEGEVKAFGQIGKDIYIHRHVKKSKGDNQWIVRDEIKGAPLNLIKRQIWHTESGKIEMISDAQRVEKEGWCSDYYGPYSAKAQMNPQGPTNGIKHVFRSSDSPVWVRNFGRNKLLGTWREADWCIRLVCDDTSEARVAIQRAKES